MTKVSKYLIFGQLTTVIGGTFCLILKPQGFSANAGVSYFGTFKASIIPYAIILFGGAWFFYKASNSISTKDYGLSKLAFKGYSIIYVLLFFTPYSLSSFINISHIALGSILFASQLLLTGWITVKMNFERSLFTLWLIEFLSGVVCAVYVPIKSGYLLQFQFVFQLAFTAFYLIYLFLIKESKEYIEPNIKYRAIRSN